MNSENEPDTLVLVGSGAVCLTPEGVAYFDDLAQKTNVLTEFIGKSTTWRVFFHAMYDSSILTIQDLSRLQIKKESQIIDDLYDTFRIKYFGIKEVLRTTVNLYRANHLSSKDILKRIKTLSTYFPAVYENVAKCFRSVNSIDIDSGKKLRGIKLRIEGIEDLGSSFLNSKSLICTTNWDLSIENYGVDRESVFHVHGSFEEPEVILLPMDTTFESITLSNAMSCWEKKRKKSMPKKTDLELIKLFRQFKDIKTLANRKSKLFENRWKRIIVWGLALNGEDAELAAILSLVAKDLHGIESRFPELILINPDASHRDRIARLFRVPAEKRIDIDPTVPCKTTFKL